MEKQYLTEGNMSKLEELIQQYCPDGVEWKTLGEVCDIHKGAQFNKTDMKEVGTYPVINGGINPSGYAEVFNEGKNTITISQGGASAGYVNFLRNKFWLGAHCYAVTPYDTVLNKYLYHFIKMNEITLQQCQYGAGIPALAKSTISSLEIPVPPLPVQEEIVRILDVFTELQAELQAELQKRLQQYNYYRDNLLSFEGRTDVQWKKLNEVATVYDGTHQTPAYKESGIPFISVENIGNIYNSRKYISREDFDKYKIKPRMGDVFMTRIGSIGVCAVFEKQADIAYYVSLALIRPNQDAVNSRYLKHIIESLTGCKELKKRTLVNAVPIKVNKDDIGKIVLPFPSLAEQQKIVSILDRFDTLTTDLTQGLPAEIEKRRQQYEYYRDKLLTFKRKGA